MIKPDHMLAQIIRMLEDQHPELLDGDKQERAEKMLRYVGWSYIDHYLALKRATVEKGPTNEQK